MSQEWFDAGTPFYLVQAFYAGKDDEGPKVRQWLYENITTVKCIMRNSHPDCEVTVVKFNNVRVVGDVMRGVRIWRGRAGDYEKESGNGQEN